MAIATRNQAEGQRNKRRFVQCEIPFIDGECKFRSMLAGEQFAIPDQAAKMKVDVRFIAIAQTWCDEDGRLLYTWESKEDLDELIEYDGKTVDTMYDVINQHCANLTPVAKLIKAAEKNSTADPGELTPTA